LRNSFFKPICKPMADRRIAADINEKKNKYSPRVRSGLPQPEENFSRQIPVIPRSIKKIRRTILIFLGKNLKFIKPFHITSFVIPRLRACEVTRLF
jgi:hypothetical protein